MKSPWVRAFAVLAVVTWGMLLVRARLDKAHVALLYLLVVLAGSALGSRALGLVLAGAAFLLFNYEFLPPYGTLVISDPLDWLVLVTFLITSVVAAELLERQRRQTRLAEERRSERDQLASLGAETLNAARAEHALLAIANVIRDSVPVARCELFVRRDGDVLQPLADTDAANQAHDTNARGLLQYVVRTGQSAIAQDDGTVHVIEHGATTVSASPSSQPARAIAMPLIARGTAVGALRISNGTPFQLSAEQARRLAVLAYYAALGIERWRLEETETTADELRRADRLKDALLAAVSHDLRTPLTTIKAIAHEIVDAGTERAGVIEDEADRLAALVDELLELSQLNAGARPLTLEIETVDDLVGVVVERTAAATREHPIEIDIDDAELLVGRFDFASALRILTNLVENAAKYSPAGSPIRIAAWKDDAWLSIAVCDRGAGVPEAERERIFEPFHRAVGATPDVRGAGLGLAIAKRLAVAQGGSLTVGAREGGGSVFTLQLQAASVPE